MNNDLEPIRTAAARRAAELALVRVVHHYGGRPEFVLLGGLVPALLCSNSPKRHAGTSDVDVQVNLEIAGGSVRAARLEEALLNTGFKPDSERVWRWELNDPDGVRATSSSSCWLISTTNGTTRRSNSPAVNTSAPRTCAAPDTPPETS